MLLHHLGQSRYVTVNLDLHVTRENIGRLVAGVVSGNSARRAGGTAGWIPCTESGSSVPAGRPYRTGHSPGREIQRSK